ncbi:MAG: site-specific integrase, partial [Gemmataceae bacterium]
RKLLDACPDDRRGLRDRALIAIGYDTLCRRSELVEHQIEDLTINRDGSGTVLVRKSKADQLGVGRLAYLSAETVGHLNCWLDAVKLTTGPIFRRVHSKHVWFDPLHPSAVAAIIKHRAGQAGFDKTLVSKLSGHSMRVGAAQDMAAAGIDLGSIMHAGGWKSPEMVMRYIEHLDVQKSGMARLYGGSLLAAAGASTSPK